MANSENNIIGQQPPAQITNSKKDVIGQEPPAQLQMANLENNIIGQEALAQIQNIQDTLAVITQEPLAQIELIFTNSPIAKINWASHMVLMDNKLPLGIRYWYMKQAVEFGWSSNILDLQIESALFQRQVKNQKVNNFTATLPKPQSDLANYLLKDPYIFDLAGVKKSADERDIEEQLVNHVTKYLLEMGTGFAFVARQKHFQIGNKDFYADLILYNIKLHAFVVVELKATPFKPEYTGQLNFYINVVNDKMKGEHDNRTIGLLLCRGKDEIMAQYALEGYNQPMGVSDYQLSKAIPDELKSTLPTIEEVEQELSYLLEQKESKIKNQK
jgi:predicted nuclease of restriction endonuclease-like (RecB) superfamily